ncbi:MAG: DUF935 family protein, partial [Kofleriaceae bacterium]
MIGDASGQYQHSRRRGTAAPPPEWKGRGSFDLIKGAGYFRIKPPDKKQKRNPQIVDRMRAFTSLICTTTGQRRLFCDPDRAPRTAEAIREWRVVHGVPSRTSDVAHLGDGASYPIVRLFPRRLRPGAKSGNPRLWIPWPPRSTECPRFPRRRATCESSPPRADHRAGRVGAVAREGCEPRAAAALRVVGREVEQLRETVPPIARASKARMTPGRIDTYNSHPAVGLTAEMLLSFYREAERGYPVRQFDCFDDLVEIDGHLRGLINGRIDSVAGCDWVIKPGRDDKPSRIAAAALDDHLRHRVAFADYLEHQLSAPHYGFAATNIVWDFA